MSESFVAACLTRADDVVARLADIAWVQRPQPRRQLSLNSVEDDDDLEERLKSWAMRPAPLRRLIRRTRDSSISRPVSNVTH